MSFIVYEVKCDKCEKEVTRSFKVVDITKIAEPIVNCDCGGKFKQIINE
jgi:predicted nucleic acid-binding Zn ribbon protein